MASLQALPQELITRIVAFLDHEPPSMSRLQDTPTTPKPVRCPDVPHLLQRPPFVTIDEPPLKALSRVCKWLRQSVFSQLFRHIQVDIIKNPLDLHILLPTRDIAPKVESALIVASYFDGRDHVDSDSPMHGVAWEACLKVLRWFNMSILTLALPPAVIGSLVARSIDQRQAWAFQIPFQVLRLEWRQDTLAYSNAETNQSIHFGNPIKPCRPSPEINILNLRPWTDLTFNAGSSVPAYSNYEHFQLVHPNWLGDSNTNLTTSSSNNAYGFKDVIHRHLRDIVCFTFVGVFPYGNIIIELSQTLQSLASMKILRLRLLPIPSRQGRLEGYDFGRAETQDLWQEFGDALDHFEETNFIVKSQLREIHLLDYTNSDPIADIIDEHTDAMEDSGWENQGSGIWTRDLDAFSMS